MITLRNITLRRGPNVLLQDVNWTVYHKQHIGIVGANGAGKSTLFAMLLQDLHADSGEIEIPSRLKLAHVAQETPGYTRSALEFVLDGDEELRHWEQELVLAEQNNDGHQIAVVHQRLSEIDAYTANARAAQLLAGLSFSHEEQQQPVSAFSGGWRVRLNLAKALMCRSDVLLLDEPTNHLDLDAVMWLEQWLIRYPGTLLVISHDRDFLDHIVDHIVHIEHQNLKCYTGNYSDFEKRRATDLLLQQAAFEKQQKKVAHLQSFVDRFRAKASKAAQAQSRIKAIEKMEIISAVQADSPFQFEFKEPSKCPNPLINLDDAVIAYGDKIVLTDLNFSIAPKDRLALVGPNGAGKSSLIKLLAGEIAPASGLRIAGSGLKIGYFAQHQIDHLNLTASPLDHMRDIAARANERELRGYLGSFGFSGQRVLDAVKNFSGGEKSRLALALLIWQQPNLLLLDEPTNHLDMDMRNALSMALQDYEGAMIIVSHDRFLIRSTVDQLLLVAQGQLNPFAGDLNDYEKWLLQYRRENNALEPKKDTVSRKQQRQQNAKEREARRPLLNKIKTLETELNNLQKTFAMLKTTLQESDLYEECNKVKLQKLLLEQAHIKKQLQTTESDWLQACAQLETLDGLSRSF